MAWASGGPVLESSTLSDDTSWRYHGGSAEAFRNEVNRYGDEWQSRARAGYDWDNAQYGQAMANAASARGDQESQLGLLRDQMDLNQQSAASRDVLRGGQQAAAGARSLATVARGGLVGQRGAMSQADQQAALLGQQAAQQANIVRQNEAQQATLRYGQAAAAMRAGDAAARGASVDNQRAMADDRYARDAQNAQRERDRGDLRAGILQGQQASMEGQTKAQSDWTHAQYQAREGRAAEARQQGAAGFAAAGAGAAALGNAVKDIGTDAFSDSGSSKGDGGKAQRDWEVANSDRRNKNNVEPISARVAGSTPGYSFHYKPGVEGEDPQEKHFGVMAQDLEKTPEGASTVMQGKQGKVVHTGKLTMLHQAMMHDFDKRLRMIERNKR